MTRHRLVPATAVAAVTALTLGLAGPAAAQVRTVADETGDAAGARFDISSFTARNAPRDLTFTVAVQGPLAPARVSVVVRIADPATGDTQFLVGYQATGSGYGTYFEKVTDRRAPSRCGALDVDLLRAQRTVRITVPQSCLGRLAGRHVVGASTQTVDGHLADITDDVTVARG